MNIDIATQLSGMYDLTRNISNTTTFFVALSGILLLCFIFGIIVLSKKNFGLHLFPILYGISAYILFYVFFGGVVSYLFSLFTSETVSTSTLIIIGIVELIITVSFIAGGRFLAMLILNRFYGKYCDAIGVGIGVALAEAAFTGITIFFNYALCTTIQQTGLVDMVNSYETVDEAITNLSTIMVFFDTPAYYYLLSGFESIMYLLFHVFISVYYFAVFKKDIKTTHIATVIGLQILMYIPSAFYSAGFLFNRITSFAFEVLIFASVLYLCFRLHNSLYKNEKIKKDQEPIPGRAVRRAPSGKMPDFNKNVNK